MHLKSAFIPLQEQKWGEKNIQGTAEKEGKNHLFLERKRSNTQKQQVTAVTVVTDRKSVV